LTLLGGCAKKHSMPRKPESPISDLLRQTIAESGVPYLMLERETGLTRASIMRFVRGDLYLRLDSADKLAAYFGLELKRK
jgi:plasmid maintenance system antidote protein VapI